jgi:hypothetical protein
MASARRRPVNSGSEERLLSDDYDAGNTAEPDEDAAGRRDRVAAGKGNIGQADSPDSVRIATGVLDTISQKYESLDYEVNFNSLMLDEIRKRGWKFVLAKVSEIVDFFSFLFRDNPKLRDLCGPSFGAFHRM